MTPPQNTPVNLRSWLICLTAAITIALLTAGCPPTPPTNGDSLVFNNTTDPTNNGASYIGSDACVACHPDVEQTNQFHAHTFALNPIRGAAPTYPEIATRAGVPEPPQTKTWNDVSYVISGYTHGAFFVSSQGYIMTTGADGVNTQWNLDFPPNGTDAGFVPYKPNRTEPLPYDYQTCFRCHTTGPQPLSIDNPFSQDNRPGIRGTWNEPGVRCEACHGPGSNHAPNPNARDLFVDSSVQTCARCHLAGDDINTINAADGYIVSNTQAAELAASGGHSQFSCMICHDPHASVTYQPEIGLRNTCTGCHTNANMAFHEGITYTRGDYAESMTCESCHMPFTGRSNTVADAAVLGESDGRIADVHGHIFRINAQSGDYKTMFSADGSQVLKDSQGRAAITLDFVCVRCHTGTGNAFFISASGAPIIADGMHSNAANRP